MIFSYHFIVKKIFFHEFDRQTIKLAINNKEKGLQNTVFYNQKLFKVPQSWHFKYLSVLSV